MSTIPKFTVPLIYHGFFLFPKCTINWCTTVVKLGIKITQQFFINCMNRQSYKLINKSPPLATQQPKFIAFATIKCTKYEKFLNRNSCNTIRNILPQKRLEKTFRFDGIEYRIQGFCLRMTPVVL